MSLILTLFGRPLDRQVVKVAREGGVVQSRVGGAKDRGVSYSARSNTYVNPITITDYTHHNNIIQLDHWRDLLATLLDICTIHDQQQGSTANPQLVETHRSLYKGKAQCLS
jgi:hypothetical protein